MKNTLLNNVLVVDFTQALAGPYCTLLMAYNGARVIKIERPGKGDMLRSAAPFDKDGTSVFWASVNSNKESCTFDLKNPDDIAIIKNIIKKADILVENFRPGVMEKLGLGYETVKALNPEIIYTSISGFGTTGPMAKTPGFDLVGQGYSGMMSINGELEKDEGRVGFPVGDVSAGMWGYMAALTAYCSRLRTGEGAFVDVSMLDGLFAMMPSEVVAYTQLGEIECSSGNIDPAAAPFGAVSTKDGAVIVAVLGPKLWLAFCEAIDHMELHEDERFKTAPLRIENRPELQAIVQPIIREKTTAEWQAILTEHGVRNGVVNNIQQTCDMPQIEAREMLVQSGSYRVPGNPMKINHHNGISKLIEPEALGRSTQKVVDEFSEG